MKRTILTMILATSLTFGAAANTGRPLSPASGGCHACTTHTMSVWQQFQTFLAAFFPV